MSATNVQSFAVATTIAAYRAVSILAANSVGYPTGADILPIGITLDTVKDTTGSIPVAMGGIAKLLFDDSVLAGALVRVDTSGRGIPFTLAVTATSATLSKAYLGLLVDAKVNTTGTIANVAILPGYSR